MAMTTTAPNTPTAYTRYLRALESVGATAKLRRLADDLEIAAADHSEHVRGQLRRDARRARLSAVTVEMMGGGA